MNDRKYSEAELRKIFREVRGTNFELFVPNSTTDASGEEGMEDETMNFNLRPAQPVSPGEILSAELEARGWTQKDIAEITGRPHQAINEIVKGSKQITPDTAIELSQALGTSSEFWLNLESN